MTLVKSVEKVEITIASGETTNNGLLTKDQIAANCVPFTTVATPRNVGETFDDRLVDVTISGFEDHFADDGLAAPISPNAYPSSVYYSNKTYCVYQGDSLDPYAIVYNHTTGAWSTPVKVGTNPLGDDNHGSPCICRDNDGYLHIFYGAHNADIMYARSDSVDDISAWTDMTSTLNKDGCYPHVLVMPNDDIYVIYRKWMFNGDDAPIYYTKSSDGGDSWNSELEIIEVVVDSDDKLYMRGVAINGTDEIHITWMNNPGGVVLLSNVYHAYLDITDGHMYAQDGTDLGTSISQAESDNDCLVRDSSEEKVWDSTIYIYGGTPYIAWAEVDGATLYYKFIKWTGSAWTSPVNITEGDDFWGCGIEMIVTSSNDIEAYLVTAGTGDWGGDIEKWVSGNGGTSFAQDTVILTESSNGRPLVFPQVTFGARHSDLKILFGEIADESTGFDYVTPIKAWAWGDSGFVEKALDAVVVTATRGASDTWDIDVIIYVVEFDPTEATVQSGTFTMTGAASTTAAPGDDFTNLLKAFMYFTYIVTHTTDDFDNSMVRGQITNPTTMTFTRESAANDVSGQWYSVECIGTQFDVQRDSFSITGTNNTANSSAFNAVTTSRTMVIASHSTNETSDDGETGCVMIDLNSTTTVRARRADGTTPQQGADCTIEFQVIQFASEEGITVQRGDFTITVTSDADTISEVVLANSMVSSPSLHGKASIDSDDGDDIGQCFCKMDVQNSTTVRGRVITDSTQASFSWEVIDWNIVFKVDGYTRDSGGSILGGCTVDLFDADDDSKVDSTTSDGGTGLFEFTGLVKQSPYYIRAFKSGSPNVMGTTKRTVAGVEE